MQRFTTTIATSALMLLAGALASPNLTGAKAKAAGAFTISSPAFQDNAMLDKKFGAKGGPRKCDGENISPPLSWSNAPEGTKSFAIIANDISGRHGLGVVHWVAYDLPGSMTALAEGAASGELTGFVGGKNTLGMTKYFGPCPDVGDEPHHYEFMIVALSVEPGKLPAGLDFPGLLAAFKDHALAATSIIGRYERAK